MVDQAQRLRELIEARSPSPGAVLSLPTQGKKSRTLAVTSGKGGVGKTNIVANLSIALARRNRKVLVVDADLSLANVDVLLGLPTRYNLSHVIWGEKRLGEIVVEGPHGVRVIPASSGVPQLAMLRDTDLAGLTEQFAELDPEMDLVLIDTAAGLSDSVLSFVLASDEVMLVTTPEPTAYVDAYQMLKNIHQNDPTKPVHLVINMAQSEREAEKTVEFLSQMSRQFLGHHFESASWILRDPEVPMAIREQKAFLDTFPHGIASRGIHRLATNLLNAECRKDASGSVSGLWDRVIGFFRGERESHAV
jgi:flagellar biosynthesis protein FlhG